MDSNVRDQEMKGDLKISHSQPSLSNTISMNAPFITITD